MASIEKHRRRRGPPQHVPVPSERERLTAQLEDLRREAVRRQLRAIHEAECERLREEIRALGGEPCCRYGP